MIKEKKNFFGFLYYHFFQKKNKIKQGRDRDNLSLMMKRHKAKSLKQVHFRLGWDERIFFYFYFFEKHKAANKHIN